MAIVQMQKLSIAASKKNRKAILELLQSMGVMEIHTDSLTDPDLRKMDTQTARMKYDRRADSFDRVLALLDTYAPEKKSMLDSFKGPGPRISRCSTACAPFSARMQRRSFRRNMRRKTAHRSGS